MYDCRFGNNIMLRETYNNYTAHRSCWSALVSFTNFKVGFFKWKNGSV